MDIYIRTQIQCPCWSTEQPKRDRQLIKCKECESCQHLDCIKDLKKMRRYICPNCQIRTSDFFLKHIKAILPSKLIKYQSGKSVLHETFSFSFNYYNYTSINQFVIIRCLKFDNKGFLLSWPPNCILKINNREILNLTQKKASKLNTPIILVGSNESLQHIKSVSSYDRNLKLLKDYILEKTVINKIEIIANSPKKEVDKSNYCIAIDVVDILETVEEAMKYIKHIDNDKKIKEMLIKDGGLDSIKECISLVDIYSGTDKIKIPARGSGCIHLGVFDLRVFLFMNKKIKKFNCPFCKKRISSLYVDEKMKKIINLEENKNKTTLLLDYDYNIYQEEQAAHNERNNSENEENNYEMQIEGNFSRFSKTNVTTPDQNNNENGNNVVISIEDDDEDAEEGELTNNLNNFQEAIGEMIDNFESVHENVSSNSRNERENSNEPNDEIGGLSPHQENSDLEREDIQNGVIRQIQNNEAFPIENNEEIEEDEIENINENINEPINYSQELQYSFGYETQKVITPEHLKLIEPSNDVFDKNELLNKHLTQFIEVENLKFFPVLKEKLKI